MNGLLLCMCVFMDVLMSGLFLCANQVSVTAPTAVTTAPESSDLVSFDDTPVRQAPAAMQPKPIAMDTRRLISPEPETAVRAVPYLECSARALLR